MFIFSGLDGVTLSSVVRFIKLAFCYDMWTIFDSMLDCALIYVKVMNDKCRIFVFLQRRAFKPPNQLLVSGDRWVVRNISVVTACLVIGCPLFEWCGNGHFFPGFCSTSLWLYIAIFYPTMLLFTEKSLAVSTNQKCTMASISKVDSKWCTSLRKLYNAFFLIRPFLLSQKFG